MEASSDFESVSHDKRGNSPSPWSTIRDAIPRVDLASLGPLPELPDSAAPSLPFIAATKERAEKLGRAHPPGGAGNAGMFWLSGEVLLCACPDCHAPMTVRLWLMVADCWRCETSIELTLEQEREARRIWRQRDVPGDVVSEPRSAEMSTATGGQAETSRLAASPPPARQVATPSLRHPRVIHRPAAPPQSPAVALPGRQRATRSRPRGSRVARSLHNLLKNMPAWLISLLFHLILLTVLGLLTSKEKEGPFITLSSRINRVVSEGGDTRIVDPTDRSVFDLGLPDSIDLQDPAMQRVVVRADQDARELQLVDPHNPYLPDLTAVREKLTTYSPTSNSLSARDPRMRIEMVSREGGTTLTEAAVSRGLKWLSRHQNADGSWSLDRFHEAASCRCGDGGSIHSDAAGTSLALLPFLGAGQTHLIGIYRDSVSQGLRWLIQNQRADGDLRGDPGQYPGMYAQGQAAIVLCEAFLMTGDEELRVPAQRAIDFIVEAQYPDGGWRYYPRGSTRTPQGDTSVHGWQLMALQSALAADLSVPGTTLENAGHFLDNVQHADGSLYAYLPGQQHSAPMTAEGLLCRIYLGWKQDYPPLRTGVDWMLRNHPPSTDDPNIYYWYYATQTLHHFGGSPWNEWNLHMRDVLVAMQETRAHAAGSWNPNGPLTSQGGRLYMTSLAICCLEVYYRHLPLFRQIDLR